MNNNYYISFKMMDYFKSVLVSNNNGENKRFFNDINTKALQAGYFVMPNACTSENIDLLKQYFSSKEINTKSTFYKTVQDVLNKNRFEIFVDQLIHYSTTYGTNFDENVQPYMPNDDTIADMNIKWDSYVVINACTEIEYFKKIFDVLCIGVALDSELVNDCCEFVITYVNSHPECIIENIISEIKNKEANRKLRVEFNIKPKNGQELFEFLYTYVTGDTLIIKSKSQIRKFGRCAAERSYYVDPILTFTDEDLKRLAEVFYRYKPFFLAMKCDKTKSYINKIRKYADKYHKPYCGNYWNNISKVLKTFDMNDGNCIETAKKNAEQLTNFKLVSISNYIIKKLYPENNYTIYMVRNGKSYIKENKVQDMSNKYVANLKCLGGILLYTLVQRLSKKAGTIRYPKHLNLTAPTSEKKFVGDIPIGSWINMGDKFNYIGIYWKGEWGTDDWDLSAYTDNGERIGWNASFKDGKSSIIYSGDVTSARPDATEILYSPERMCNFNIHVNRYRGQSGTKFNMFYGQEKIENCTHNYRVSPESILFKADFAPVDNSSVIARVIDNSIYFTNFSTGNSLIAKNIEGLSESLDNDLICRLDLKSVLQEAGFVEVDDDAEEVDFDLSTPDKSILIDLFA